jgi:hypothetical protein
MSLSFLDRKDDHSRNLPMPEKKTIELILPRHTIKPNHSKCYIISNKDQPLERNGASNDDNEMIEQ